MGRGLSITAFVLSFVIPLVGFILGIVAYNEAKKEKDSLKGLAIASIVIGGFFTLLLILGLVMVAVVWNDVRGTIDAGSAQIEINSRCISSIPQIISADASSDTLSVSTNAGGIVVYVNGEKKSEMSENLASQTEMITLYPSLEEGDVITVVAKFQGMECPQNVTLTV